MRRGSSTPCSDECNDGARHCKWTHGKPLDFEIGGKRSSGQDALLIDEGDAVGGATAPDGRRGGDRHVG